MSSAAAQQSHIKTNSICHTHTLLRRGLLGPSLVLLLWGRRIFSRPHTYPLMPHLHARILNSASLIVLRTSGKSGKNERQCSLFEHSHQGRLQLRGSRKKGALLPPARDPENAHYPRANVRRASRPSSTAKYLEA